MHDAQLKPQLEASRKSDLGLHPAQVVLYYGLSRDIRRSVVYGPHPRNRMDIYLPARSGLHASAPVVVYVTGACSLQCDGVCPDSMQTLQGACSCMLSGTTLVDKGKCCLRRCMHAYAGGAWIIGYKAWGALLARRISMAGAVVCCLDYRNFPQVSQS